MLPLIIMALESDTDREFISWIYTKYKKLVYFEVRKIVNDDWAAQDIMQDSIVQLVNKVSLLKSMEESKLVNYIITTVRNQAKNHLRKYSGNTMIFSIDNDEINIEYLLVDDIDIEQTVVLKDRLTQFLSIWTQLDESCRTLLENKYILELSDTEIAQSLGVKPASVRMLLTRARREALAELNKACVVD